MINQKKKHQDRKPSKIINEQYKIVVKFVVKFDYVFMALCLFMAIGMMALLIDVNGINQNIANIAIAVTLSALISSFMFNYFKQPFHIGFEFKNKNLMTDLKYIIIGIALVLMNSLIFSKISSASAFQLQSAFTMNFSFITIQSVSEELTFSLFIQSIIIAVSKNKQSLVLLTLLNGVLFSLYHIFVYSSKPILFAELFVFRIILATIYTKTKRISIPIMIHLTNNLIPIIIAIATGGISA